MRALVTGAAGFIGSHLVDELLARGWEVRGIDCFTPYYDRSHKELNLSEAAGNPAFELVPVDLSSAALRPLLADVEVVFHAAGQPGVRRSWAEDFESYVRHNVLATQRLLEASRHVPLHRFVFSSSSSVYGNDGRFPTSETDDTRPFSPYGVTKLAAENLCLSYAANWEVPVVSLRYFTVYGPRQRPDMAVHRLIEAGLSGSPFPLYGSGDQQRDFTYVGDVVAANVAAAGAEVELGSAINIAGGESISMTAVIEEVSALLERPIQVERRTRQPGDVRRTRASIELAEQVLDWRPSTSREQGLRRQIEWQLDRASGAAIVAQARRPLRSAG